MALVGAHVRTRLAVDRVKPWLTHIVCPSYHNDPIYVKAMGLLLKTRGYLFLTFILYFVGVVVGVMGLTSELGT